MLSGGMGMRTLNRLTAGQSGLRKVPRLGPAALLLWICAWPVHATDSGIEGKTFKPSPDQGMILGSISFPGEPADYQLVYHQIDTDGEPVLGASNRGGFIEFTADRTSSVDEPQLFAIELPAGDYEFTSWRVMRGRIQVLPKEDFAVRFTVEPQRANYVGSFRFEHGPDVQADEPIVSYGNRFERDMELLASYRNIDFGEVAPSIVEPTELTWTQNSAATDRTLALIVFSSF